jgi:hypothetical protein
MYWLSWSLGAFVAERHLRGDCLLIPRISLYALGAIAVASSFFKPLSSMTFLLFALLTAGVVAKLLHNADQKISIPEFYATTYSKLGSGVSASIYCINRCFWLSPKLRLRLRPALTFILFFCLSCASRRGFSSFPLLAFFTGFVNFRVLRSESCFVREMRLTMRRSEPAPLRLSR